MDFPSPALLICFSHDPYESTAGMDRAARAIREAETRIGLSLLHGDYFESPSETEILEWLKPKMKKSAAEKLVKELTKRVSLQLKSFLSEKFDKTWAATSKGGYALTYADLPYDPDPKKVLRLYFSIYATRHEIESWQPSGPNKGRSKRKVNKKGHLAM